MLTTAFAMLLSYPLLLLRTDKITGSFPKPLPPEKEQEYIALCAAGDEKARSILIEHNLRLVAHIIKKGYPSRRDFLGMFKKFEIFR